MVKRYDTPADGAVLVTAKQAAEAAKSKTVINGPEFEGGKAGENYYWVFSLSSPARDGETGEPLKPKGAADTSHLAANSIAAIDAEVDGDGQEPQVDIQRFMTDRSRVEDESFNTVKVTTMRPAMTPPSETRCMTPRSSPATSRTTATACPSSIGSATTAT